MDVGCDLVVDLSLASGRRRCVALASPLNASRALRCISAAARAARRRVGARSPRRARPPRQPASRVSSLVNFHIQSRR